MVDNASTIQTWTDNAKDVIASVASWILVECAKSGTAWNTLTASHGIVTRAHQIALSMANTRGIAPGTVLVTPGDLLQAAQESAVASNHPTQPLPMQPEPVAVPVTSGVSPTTSNTVTSGGFETPVNSSTHVSSGGFDAPVTTSSSTVSSGGFESPVTSSFAGTASGYDSATGQSDAQRTGMTEAQWDALTEAEREARRAAFVPTGQVPDRPLTDAQKAGLTDTQWDALTEEQRAESRRAHS